MHTRGFTLLELLFVMTIVALLAGLALPLLGGSTDRARESALKEDLHAMRKAIDDYFADVGKYPEEMPLLIQKHYLKNMPADPMTERADSWIFTRQDVVRGQGGIIDVHSNSDKIASDGRPYQEW